jgi:hypothetical protein
MTTLSSFDYMLFNTYKTIVGVNTLSVDFSRNTSIKNSLSLLSNLYISNTSLFINSITTFQKLNISSSSTFNNITSMNTFYINNNSLFNSSVINNQNLNVLNSILNNSVYISNNSIIDNNLSINSNLYVSGIANFQTNLYTNNINPINDSINIIGNNILIGNGISTINIPGTASFIASTQLNIVDKMIVLNSNNNNTGGGDIGNNSGILILGTGGSGFIQTSPDASRFLIKVPNDYYINYISTLDNDNNLLISGTTILSNDVTLLSSLNVSGNSYFNNSVSINSNLNILGVSYIYGNSTILSNLNLLSNSCILGNLTINSNLYISNNSILPSPVNLNNLLNISSYSIFNKVTINSNLNILNSLFFNNNVTINNILNISNNTIFNNSSIISNSLNVFNNLIVNNNITCNSLNLSNDLFINSNSYFNNNVNISGNTIILGNTTINSNININGNINLPYIPNYIDNGTAKAAGVPIFGWYRTGGMIKIRLDDIPPTVYLSGQSTINTSVGNYIDPGAYAIDNSNNIVPVYISSVNNGSIIITFNNALVSGSSVIIQQINSLSSGNYTTTYQATDYIGNIGYIYRIINLLNNIYTYDTTNGYIYNSGFNFNSLITSTYWYIEGWIYIKSLPSRGISLIDFKQLNTNNSNQFSLILDIQNANNGFVVYSTNNISGGTGWNNSELILSRNMTLPLNNWLHFAYQKNNTNLTVYLNGQNVGSSTNLLWINNLSNLNYFQTGTNSNIQNESGFVCSIIRAGLTIGTSNKYTSNFIPKYNFSQSEDMLFLLGNNYTDIISNITLTVNNVSKSNIQFTQSNINPTINISGPSIFNVYNNSYYIDPGAYAVDNNSNNLSVYLSALVTGSTNLLTNNILINSISTLITQTSSLSSGYYTTTYQASDFFGNISLNYRTLNIRAAAFNVTNAILTIPSPSMNYQSLGGNDWTFECYLYETAYRSSTIDNYGAFILDLRTYQQNPRPITSFYLRNGYWGICNVDLFDFNSVQNPLNVWNHWTIMKSGGNIYAFLNGAMVQYKTAPSYLNSTLTGNNGLTIGGVTDVPSEYGGGGNYHFNGMISQLMLRLGAQYPISGFTPLNNLSILAQSSGSQTLIFVDTINGVPTETISNITLTQFGTTPVPITYR